MKGRTSMFSNGPPIPEEAQKIEVHFRCPCGRRWVSRYNEMGMLNSTCPKCGREGQRERKR